MKKRAFSLLVCGLVPFQTLVGQSFSSGSNGSFGPLNVEQNMTIDLPPDGIIHATTINIAQSRTLKFNRNLSNTPVYLLATGEVFIRGTIDVDGGRGTNFSGGQAGPGGFDGGNPGSLGTPAGAGFGPGGGGAGPGSRSPDGVGPGSYATASDVASEKGGRTYGSPLLIPIVGGSGGGGTTGNPGRGGGGAGGAILIASDTSIELASGGRIFARGAGNAFGDRNGGSGGAVRFVAPLVFGGGQIIVSGGTFGGNGRIRIDTLDRSNVNYSFVPESTTAIGSLMLVFPDPLPRLDIVGVGDRDIALGSGPAVVLFPFGSSPNRTVRVRAENFNEIVPIQVTLTPDNGEPIKIDGEINNRNENPAETTINITIPLNVQTTINVWTR